MQGISSPVRVDQEGSDGLSLYSPVRVICLEIQFCFLTGALSGLIKLPKPPLWGDTHKDLHVAVVVDQSNKVLGTRYFATTLQCYRQMLAWMTSFGELKRIGIKCTGTYGSGLFRYCQNAGLAIPEVTAPERMERRKRDKK